MDVKKSLAINQPEVGQLIRELRLLLNLTQEQLATNLGVTFSTISRWENGRSKPSPLGMQKIEILLQQTSDKGKSLLDKYLSKSN